LTFLPYHSTSLFLSLLSILPRKISPIFRFLYPSIAALENPQYHTIVSAAKTNDGFFRSFNGYVLKVAKDRHHSSVLLSFWAGIATQAVDGRVSHAQSGRETINLQKKQDFLTLIVPVLIDAFSLPNVPDLILGACMIVTVLAAKGHLEDGELDSLMESVASGWTASTIDARITCLAVLAQERESYGLSKDTTKKLLKCSEFVEQIQIVSQRYRVDRLILGYILGCLKRLHRTKSDLVNLDGVANLLQADLLTQPELRIVIKELLLTARKIQENGGSITSEQRSNLADLVTFLAESSKWSGLFNKVLAKSAISRDDLELSLQTVIPAGIEAGTVEADRNVEMIDAPPSVSEFDTALAKAADKELHNPSFLSTMESPDFEFFAALYVLALSSELNIKRFLVLPALRSDGANGAVPIISFLLRITCSRYPPVARVAALRIVSDHLKATDNPDQDFQCIIPYLIVALSDHSKNVRKAAADCTIALNRQYKLLLSSENQNTNPAILGKDTLYTSALGKQWTSPTKEANELVRKLLTPDLEEYVLDASNITIMLSAAIDGGSNSKKSGVAELRSSSRSAIFSSLASHAVFTPLLQVKFQLFNILKHVGKSGSNARSQLLIPAFKRWIISPAQNSYGTSLSQLEVDLAFLQAIAPQEKDALLVLKDIVIANTPGLRSEVLQAGHQVLRETWSSLMSADQKDIGLALFECCQSDSENLVALGLALESLRSLNLPTELLVALLEKLPNALQMPDQPPSTKRRRTSRSEMSKMMSVSPADLASALRKYTLVLEIIDSSKPASHPELLKGLFHVLGEIHHYRAQTESGMVYLQGLAINSLLAIVDKLKDTKVSPGDKSVIRTDLLVECIRHTSNPQVQNAALLLVSCLAVWQPEVVLHSVMPIFTFMGTTILRQADDYSAHVIDQTVSHVVPPLVISLRKKNKEVVRGASDLLLSFTAAFEHIPLHRRLGLFEHVTKTLGPNDCLFAIMAMIVDRYPTDNEAGSFVVELVNIFDPSIDLQAIRQYVGLVTDIFKQRRSLSEVVLNLKDKTSEQVEAIANNLLEALAELLDNSRLRSRLVESFHPDQQTANAQRTAFSGLMEEAIRLSQFLLKRPALYHSSSRVLSHIFKILPTIDLIKCAQSLLQQGEDEVSRVVLHSIDAQVRGLKQQNAETSAAMLEFIPHVTRLIEKSTNVMLKHSAISCIDQIIERFGKKDTSYVISAAQVVTGTAALRDPDERLRVVSMYCLVTIIDVLRDEFIPLVPQVLSVALDYLGGSLSHVEEKGTARERTAKVSFTLINSLIEHLPFLLTGEEYLDRVLKLAQATAMSGVSGVTASSRSEFYKLLGRNIDAAELFAAFDRSYPHCQQQQGYNAVVEYFDAIKFAINNRSKATIVKNSSSLFELLLKAFDHRRVALSTDSMLDVTYTPEEVDRLENVYNDVAITMIMKLNDVTFRPFFARLVEWVTALSSKDKSGRIFRATALYRFLTTLFERLKVCFNQFVTYL
jgi:U3 small nucleolar RNA-associated protein 10